MCILFLNIIVQKGRLFSLFVIERAETLRLLQGNSASYGLATYMYRPLGLHCTRGTLSHLIAKCKKTISCQ